MKIKNVILFILLILLINIPLNAQINKNGIPFIKNYSPNDYNASEQNWAICEDDRGVIYVGNTDDGILEFDGKSWSKIPISNGSIVRSLAYLDGTVYVGGVEEFGYLAPDKSGKMNYYSLTDQLNSPDFKDVWKIYAMEGSVYFCCDEIIYMFSEKKLEKTYKNVPASFLSFIVFDKIYWGNIDNGLYELQGDTVVMSIGGEFYKEKNIFVMLPWEKNEILIATIGQGSFIYNIETGLSKDLESLGKSYKKLNELLNLSDIYNGIQISNGNYAFATLNNGCIIFNSHGEVLHKLDKENGLQDATIINLYETIDGNLWLGLNQGISYAEISSPFTSLGQEYGLEGIMLDVTRYKSVFFVATNIGVYYLDYDSNELPIFKSIPIDNNSVFHMGIFNVPNTEEEKLIFATKDGILEYMPNQKTSNISELAYNSRIVYQSKFHPEKLYIGYSPGLALLEYKNGQWIDKGKQNDISDEIHTIIEDEKGNLWLGTSLNGVIKLNIDETVVRYGLEKGLPELSDNKVYFINGQIICGTKKGVYYYNDESDHFEKYKGFGEKYFSNDDAVRIIRFINGNEIWIVLIDPLTNNEYIERLIISQDRIVSIEDVSFKRLFKNSFNDIAFDGDNGIWIATSDAVYNYQDKFKDDFSKFYKSLIRKIEMGIDSVVFWGTYYKDTSNLIVDLNQPKELIKTVEYKNNSFNFCYSTPYIPSDEIKYSYKLDGFDGNWSSWDYKSERRYTNLNEGHYTFMAKAKNIYGIESEVVSYKFSIKPPWYRSILALFFYFVLAIFVIIVIVKVYTRRLEQEKIRLEQIVKERTEEVVKQKDELEIQRDEIADKNRSITDSIEYASRIQKAILPSNEFAKEILPEHFILFRPRDIVSGDFYWMTKKDNLIVIIAADCTGHGVPGAFMSMLGVSFLNEIVNRHEVTSASVILNSLRKDIKKTLGQEGKEGEAKDGMDIALCIVDLEKMKMQYAGAYNPLYLFRNNEFIEVKADRMPIGIWVKEKESFTNNEIDLQKGDVFYIFSDGYQDQFGGEDGQKFKTKNYKKFLLDIHQKPMAEQREILDTRIDEWRGKWEQIDDIIIVGVRV
ncbi:MAG: SpoIIE family protein phosphatase [Bacteroidales bacterium]|nr:SpoIIE family protein phosphatase [Bacteroidales bacterium]